MGVANEKPHDLIPSCSSCGEYIHIQDSVESWLHPWTQIGSGGQRTKQAVYSMFPVQYTVLPVYIALCIQ
jgi:hypothetical protein